jgi:hypothetical protein
LELDPESVSALASVSAMDQEPELAPEPVPARAMELDSARAMELDSARALDSPASRASRAGPRTD